ncbi:MAG: hypothetical protein LBG28_06940 [Tannerella sp.]|jgi:hypothetical protein|nr:hypothetical protein [Tannerella sp.]
MKINDKIDKLKGRSNPFRVPEGYFENFTGSMMSRLPNVSVKRAKEISIYNRVKPWLYMAAAFAGLIILFNVLNRTAGTSSEDETLPEKTTLSALPSTPGSEAEENDEFLEYIEDMYADKYALSYIYDFMND